MNMELVKAQIKWWDVSRREVGDIPSDDDIDVSILGAIIQCAEESGGDCDTSERYLKTLNI